MAYRYYSTLRPLMVGGIPFPKQSGESITTIVNFEEGRTYCKDIDRPRGVTSSTRPRSTSSRSLITSLCRLRRRPTMSEVKIKELDKSLIHQANSNSMSGKRGDISAHEYEVYCQKL